MKGSIRQRLIQGGVAVATSAIMLSAFVGLSAAAPGGHGQSGESHGHAAVSNGGGGGNGNSGNHGSDGDHGRGHDGDHGQAFAAVNGGQSGDDDDRPGFGCGDKNHVHTGPPGGGPSFNPCTIHVVTSTQTFVSGTVTQTITTTETLTGTVTETATETGTSTTTSST